MDYFILATCVCAGCAKFFVNKRVKKQAIGMEQTMLVNAISFSIAFLMVVIFLAFSSSFGFANPLWLTLSNAVCILLSQICIMKAVELGSTAITSLFVNGNFVIPTIWGAIYYSEPVHYLQIIGIVLILVSFIIGAKKEQNEKFNVKWLLCTLLGMLSAGILGIVQKIFGREYAMTYSLDAFLAVSFVIIVVISLIIYATCKIKGNITKQIENKTMKFSRSTITLILVLGVILGYHNKFCTYLSGALPSALYFPIINGGVIVLVAIVSAILFKEKLSKRQVLSTVMGFVSIIIISIGKLLLG